MAERLTSLFIIFLHMHELAVGDYCQNENKPSIQFCQNGTISGLKVYINGSSVKTKEDLTEKGCICYLELIGNREIVVDAKESCLYCGLKVRLGNTYLRSSYYGSTSHGWGSIVLNDTKVTMTLALDEGTGSLNTAFCIAIHENKPVIPAVLTLTCEDPVMKTNTSSNASSTGPNIITSSPNMTREASKSESPTSAGTDKPLTKFEMRTAEISVKDTNGVQEPKTTNPSKVATITAAQNNGMQNNVRAYFRYCSSSGGRWLWCWSTGRNCN
ncbi:hypothetical protein CHS0354_016525 [Potamilus streckersoni]|uniref:Uncharacterized protein n=1 Tax=Potamilus streckersoni TaxID=2493646 RepID=A0AAE0SIR6_9BIVA|nr:hypothetical protein CHS0354_016525 [Potamilus streckersoni]